LCLALLLTFWPALAALGAPRETLPHAQEAHLRMLLPEEQPDSVRNVMDVRVATERAGTRIFSGKLREPAVAAFERLRSPLSRDTLHSLGRTTSVQPSF
jgi:hypothetical protein